MDNYQDSRCVTLQRALEDESVGPIDLPFSFLKAITGEFHENQRIGGGGFGDVYKGKLSNGMVAVKKLHENIEVLEENFLREIDCLIQVKHKNTVRFLGYCSETQQLLRQYQGKNVMADVRQRLFCFEYLSKGSLDKHLTEASSGLQWRERYRIIKGICEGVGYLHQQRIIHMDLKPQNILLDDGMAPKISDFGLSRRLNENQSKTITENIVGSWGYLAPEFLKSRTITFKTDIYSLGVIIIEILMGCKGCPNIDEVLKTWTNTFGTSGSHPLLEQVKLCAEIGINCMDDNPSNRPAIEDIIRRLDETDISDTSVTSAAISSAAGKLVDEVMSMTISSAPSQREQPALGRSDQDNRRAKKACKPIRISVYMAQGETSSKVMSMTVSSAPTQRKLSLLGSFDQNYRRAKIVCKPMQISAYKAKGETTTKFRHGLSESELLDVHPLELRFPFVAKKRIHCSLNIINRTELYVAYRIIPQFPDIYAPIAEDAYIICPLLTDTVNVIMVEQQHPPLDAGMFEILMIAMGSHSDLKDLISSIGNDLKLDSNLLKRVEELGGEVHAPMLRAVACRPKKRSSDPNIVSRVKFGNIEIETIDVHPTLPWILVGHGRHLTFYDYEKEAKGITLDIEEEAGILFSIRRSGTNVKSVRFIPRKQWFVAGDCWGYIHVYACGTWKEIKRLRATYASKPPVIALAIHPTRPYLLSACEGGWIRLWDWDNGWTCCGQTKVAPDCVLVKFNPKCTQTYTVLYRRSGLQVRSIDPFTRPITTIEDIWCNLCDDVFDEAGRDHVVISTDNGLLDIWDWRTGTRVHTLLGTGSSNYTAVACHPTLPLIAAGVKAYDFLPPVVHFWNTTNYRLQKTVICMYGSTIKYLGLVGTRRLVVQTDGEIEIIEIDMLSLAYQQ